MLFLFCFFNIWNRIYAFGCSDWLLMFWYFVFRCRRVYAPAVVSRAGQWEALRHRAPVSCHLPIIILLRTNRKTTTKTITKTKTMSVVICRWSHCSENWRPGLIWILDIIILCELRLLWQKKMINENLRIWQKTLLVAEGERRKKRSEKRSEMFAATSAVSLEGFYWAKNLSSWIFSKLCKNVRCHLWCRPEEPRGERDKGEKTEKVRRDDVKTFWIGPLDWNLLWINQYLMILMEHRCESSWIRL